MKLELRKFDITSITDDKVVVMIGKRNTGKSFFNQGSVVLQQQLSFQER